MISIFAVFRIDCFNKAHNSFLNLNYHYFSKRTSAVRLILSMFFIKKPDNSPVENQWVEIGIQSRLSLITIPSPRACETSSVRVLKPVFSIKCWIWLFTVPREI